MPAYTSPDNIQYPTSGDQVAPLETVFANLAQSTQNALTAVSDQVNDQLQIHTYRWANAAARAAQTGMAVGDLGYQSDNDTIYRYASGGWRQLQASSQMIPSSVVGGTLNATTGVVTFTGSSSVSLNGVFSNLVYDNYEITIDVTARSAVVDINMRLRASGTDNTATAYSGVKSHAVGTGQVVSTPAASGAGWAIDAGGQPRSAVKIDLHAPALATTTIGWSDFASGAAYSGRNNLSHSVASGFDGFTLAPASGTISGTVRVKGLA